MANYLLNAPVVEDETTLVAVPQIMVRLGTASQGIVWTIRRAVCGLKEHPRLWQGEKGQGPHKPYM
eukprot:12913400-Prorocentrum_lima.AAC.1